MCGLCFSGQELGKYITSLKKTGEIMCSLWILFAQHCEDLFVNLFPEGHGHNM